VRPLVAVSTGRRTHESREQIVLNASYARALTGVGLVPLIVPPLIEPGDAAAVLVAASGVLLTGGADVEPAAYGAAPHSRLGSTDPERDAVEIALLRGAHERHQPVLAICRGIQLVNVALGGTLVQDLPSERPSSVTHADSSGRHALRIAPGSLLHRTVGDLAWVNSRHHQAVGHVAPGLRPVAWAEDGVIEALEWADEPAPWMLAVQWHPEDEGEQALFRGFARAVAAEALTDFAARGPR
jgi:putative glutamine amidotransferase